MKLKCVYMRGGTSKAVFFHKKDLPEDVAIWPKLFMKVMGTPDSKQIDGMGGAAQITSKIAVVAPSEQPDCDVDYTFFQVGIEEPIVADNLNCGNISCAVGPFAVDEGLVTAEEPVTVVRVYNTNTRKVIEEHIPVKSGKALTKGVASIMGVPGTGAGMDIFFEKPGGAATGKLFPTGNVLDILEPEGYPSVEATLIDCSNPVMILASKNLGLKGSEIEPFLSDKELLTHIESIRSAAAVKFGFVEQAKDATEQSLAAPKVAVISRPHDYKGSDGNMILKEDMDICSRIISVGAFHKTHPITSGIAIAAAASIPGTVAWNLIGENWDHKTLKIGHPYGILPIKIVMDGDTVAKAGTIRTARRIMDGYIYIEKE